MPDDLVVVDMEGFYNFPWGRGKTYGFTTKADKNLQDIAQAKSRISPKNETQSKSTGPEGSSEGNVGGSEQRKVISNEDQSRENTEDKVGDQPEEITVTVDSGGELSVNHEALATSIDDHSYSGATHDHSAKGQASSLVTLSRSEDEIVLEVKAGEKEHTHKTPLNVELPKRSEDSKSSEKKEEAKGNNTEGSPKKKLTLKETKKLCPFEYDNVKVTMTKMEILNRKTVSSTRIQNVAQDKKQSEKDKDGQKSDTDMEMEESFSVKAKDFLKVNTKHSEMVIPKAELECYEVDGTLTSVASRTLLSLRRAEDCSFEDIRVFNAQDNFVVKSCEIEVKLRDPDESGASDNFVRITELNATDQDGKVISGKFLIRLY